MCGLVGFYPKKNKKVDLSKLYALWMLNEERGVHSCGIAYGDMRISGVGASAKATHLIKDVYKTMKDENLVNKPIMCHTRHATNGQYTNYNAHPFKWYRENENNYFMFMHNGVIRSLDTFKKKLGMGRHNDDMMIIDSHVLGLAMYDSFVHILSEEEILTQYDGNAAFICYDHTNKFKVWKGANNDIEERPLYYVETVDGWYFCSIDTSLENVFLVEPTCVKNNTLMTFNNYKLESSVVYKREVKTYESALREGHSHNLHLLNNRYSKTVNTNKNLQLDVVQNALKLILKNIVTPKDTTPLKELLSPQAIGIASYGINGTIGKYINKATSSPVDGVVKILQTLALTTISKDLGKEYKFDDGVLVNEGCSYKKINDNFKDHLRNNKTYEDIFNEMYMAFRSTIVDFIPLYNEDKILKMIVYKNNASLDYITANDRITTTVQTKFSEMMQAYSLNGLLFLKTFPNNNQTK